MALIVQELPQTRVKSWKWGLRGNFTCNGDMGHLPTHQQWLVKATQSDVC